MLFMCNRCYIFQSFFIFYYCMLCCVLESSSSSSESESESHSSSTSGSSGARRARHARLLNAAARPRYAHTLTDARFTRRIISHYDNVFYRINAKSSAGLAAAVSTAVSKKEVPTEKGILNNFINII